MVFGGICLFMSSYMMVQGFGLLRQERVAFARVMFTFSLVMVTICGLHLIDKFS